MHLSKTLYSLFLVLPSVFVSADNSNNGKNGVFDQQRAGNLEKRANTLDAIDHQLFGMAINMLANIIPTAGSIPIASITAASGLGCDCGTYTQSTTSTRTSTSTTSTSRTTTTPTSRTTTTPTSTSRTTTSTTSRTSSSSSSTSSTTTEEDDLSIIPVMITDFGARS
ncbi:hypothetical protein AX774_g8144 [Zancudomyces culisetae]|uniref:Uncharacterized protein n=1 Tax=Zancudomyces culisetae TaxID=1213189 RepID=A0A1R1PBX6_ZANCU|nr:hypothetical protein AX774_g8144 [Zancudomyces culisetae]|eukprot:OMH78460.1 hypothetical protein AX774_g8144 [Zancudomyces culisetae]